MVNCLSINEGLPNNSIYFYTTFASKLVEKLPQSFNKVGKNFVESFYRNKGVHTNSYSFIIVS